MQTNLLEHLTLTHIETLKMLIRQAQIEYLTSNKSDQCSIAVVFVEVSGTPVPQISYSHSSNANEIRIHICSQGATARWQHFAQEQKTLDDFLYHNGIVLGRRNFTEQLDELNINFPLAYEQYKQQTINLILIDWPAQELIENAIVQYQHKHQW